MEAIISIVLIGIMYCVYKWPEIAANNRMPLCGRKTDWNALNNDLMNGKTNKEVYNKINKGEYDIPDRK